MKEYPHLRNFKVGDIVYRTGNHQSREWRQFLHSNGDMVNGLPKLVVSQQWIKDGTEYIKINEYPHSLVALNFNLKERPVQSTESVIKTLENLRATIAAAGKKAIPRDSIRFTVLPVHLPASELTDPNWSYGMATELLHEVEKAQKALDAAKVKYNNYITFKPTTEFKKV